MNVARQAALKAGVPVEVPAETINRVCGSGLQAVVHAVEAVQAGFVDVMMAGGTESMSNAPFLLKGARWGYRMGNAEVIDSMLLEGLTCAMNGCHMGVTAEEIVKRYGVSRADQDAFAAESQRRAAEAVSSGAFDREIVAVNVPQRKGPPLVVTRDEYPRAGHDSGEAGRAQSRIHEGWHRDRRQLVRHQRRRGGARSCDGEEGAGAWPQAAGANSGVLHDWRRPDADGDRSGRGDAQGAQTREALGRGPRRRRTERGIRRRSHWPSSANLGSIRRRSTFTAAQSHSAIPSARAGHGS